MFLLSSGHKSQLEPFKGCYICLLLQNKVDLPHKNLLKSSSETKHLPYSISSSSHSPFLQFPFSCMHVYLCLSVHTRVGDINNCDVESSQRQIVP